MNFLQLSWYAVKIDSLRTSLLSETLELIELLLGHPYVIVQYQITTAKVASRTPVSALAERAPVSALAGRALR